MGIKTGLAQIDMRKEDGSFFSRIEMEKQLREKLGTVHHRRLKAINLGLPSKTAYDMYPISVTHWILDQWCEKGEITGWVLGVRSEFKADNDPEYFRQFTQRLAIFVEEGWAMLPNPGEGIDMSQMNMPPGPPIPAMPTNGQSQQFAPPAPPQMPPGMPGMPPMPGMAPTMPPQPQQYQQPPMPPGPPMAPGMPPMPQPPMPPGPPQPQFPQQGYPQAGPPMPPQQYQQPMMAPPQQAASQGVPTKADPNRQWGKSGKGVGRRTKEEVAEDAAYEAWCKAGGDPNIGNAPQQPVAQPQYQQPTVPQTQPPQQSQSIVAPPNPFGGMGGPPVPQAVPPQPQFGGQFAPPPTPPQQVGGNEEKLLEEIKNLEDQVFFLKNQITLINKGLAYIIRGMTRTSGEMDLHLVLTEQNVAPR